jgi:hypothetical protein
VYVTLPASTADLEDEERSGGDGRPVEKGDDGAGYTIEELDARRQQADLKVAKEPEIVHEEDGPRVHAIYRNVETGR